MATEKFCLKWNDFESNISVAFRDLRDEKDFFDVTLACEDETLSAHKVILSACSPFFRAVLRKSQHPHPLLYLKGVKLKEMQSVLNFMYHGEVNVAQEELNSFLMIAEELKVKGLTQGSDSGGGSQKRAKSPSSSRPSTHVPVKRPRQSQTDPSSAISRPVHDDEDIQEVMPVVKSEPAQGQETPGHHLTTYDEESYTDYGQYDDTQEYDGSMVADYQQAGLDGNKESLVRRVDGGFECKICGKVIKHYTNIKRHMQDKHSNHGQPFSCKFCMRSYKTKNSMDTHIYTYHKETISADVTATPISPSTL